MLLLLPIASCTMVVSGLRKAEMIAVYIVFVFTDTSILMPSAANSFSNPFR
jgi:hypothetical protein